MDVSIVDLFTITLAGSLDKQMLVVVGRRSQVVPTNYFIQGRANHRYEETIACIFNLQGWNNFYSSC